jgi:hypothetical protein
LEMVKQEVYKIVRFRSENNMCIWPVPFTTQHTHSRHHTLVWMHCSVGATILFLTPQQSFITHIPPLYSNMKTGPAWFTVISVSVAPHTQYEWCLPLNTVIKDRSVHASYFWCEMLYPRISTCLFLFLINHYFLPLSHSCEDLQKHIDHVCIHTYWIEEF